MAIAFLTLAASADAKPPHKAALVRYYGDLLSKRLQSCNTCHLSDEEVGALKDSDRNADEKKPWNAFGRALRDVGKKQMASRPSMKEPGPILDRIRIIADDDADSDGVANELELFAGTSPGNANDKPAADQLAAAKAKLAEFRSAQAALVWNPFHPVERPAVPQVNLAPRQSRRLSESRGLSEDPKTVDAWIRNPIDAFVAAEYERVGIKPRPPAPKEVLLRRVYLDLIGLPPTRDELHEFLNDTSPDAYEHVVDRLLASPRYGERWARHWMDVWRYSDWAGWGQQVRDSQPHIWHWRDWIIESLNADKGYERMVVEMLAADELAPTDRDALRATGFLARNYKRLSREQWLTDTVDHTSRALLGITIKCAHCHDHMYDVLTQEEHYRFRAIFEPYQVRIDPLPGQLDPEKGGLARVYDADLEAKTYLYVRGDERTPDKSKPMVPGTPAFIGGGELKVEPVTLPVESFYPSLAPFVVDELLTSARTRIESAKGTLDKLTSAQPPADGDSVEVKIAKANLSAAEAEFDSLEKRVAVERAKYLDGRKSEDQIKSLAQSASKTERQASLAKAEAAVLSAEEQLAKARPDKDKDDKTKKAFAEAEKKLEESKKARDAALAAAKDDSDKYSPLGPIYPRTSTGRRLALARWIADPQNPLTARVAANHIWSWHFGRGLVPSMDEFGQNRKEPSHPALLDWLAAELMQPSIDLTAPADPHAGWSMKHLHRLIVTSNTYRTASTNDPETYAIDPDNRYFWRTTPRRLDAEAIRDSLLFVCGNLDLAQGGPDLDQNQGLVVPRRSLYFRSAPEKQMLFLQIFDMAAPSECYERRESVVPQQALALANSDLSVREARRLARRLNESAGDPASYITAAFEETLSRSPTADEFAMCAEFLEQQAIRFQNAGDQAKTTTPDRNDLAKPSADAAIRARENLAHVLLNHHEFVSIR